MQRNPIMTTDTTEQRELLWELIKDTRFAMFTTRHSNGHLHSRPMTTQNSKVDEDDSLWFFMSKKGDPVADFEADPTVNVAYANPGKDQYVSVSGTAALVNDNEKKRQLWSKMAEAWFPGGRPIPTSRSCRSASRMRTTGTSGRARSSSSTRWRRPR
jgi:general stress protein 26